MTRRYSVDFRERVMDARRAKTSAPEIERIMKVSSRTIYGWEAKVRAEGSLAPRPTPGRPPRIAAEQLDALRAQVASHPDATLAEHCAFWLERTGTRVGYSTMGRTINRLGLRRKKRV